MYVKWIPSGDRIACTLPLTWALNWKFPFTSDMNFHVDKNVAPGFLRVIVEKIELMICIFWRYPSGSIIGIPTQNTTQCTAAASFITDKTFDA